MEFLRRCASLVRLLHCTAGWALVSVQILQVFCCAEAKGIHWKSRRAPLARSETTDAAGSPGKLGVRAMMATMALPGDRLPRDLMLPHQLSMLSGSSAQINKVVLLRNQPPWLRHAEPSYRVQEWHADSSLSPCDRSPEAAGLQMLVGSQRAAAVRAVDYSRLNDADFLSQFFTISEVDGESESRVGTSVGALLRGAKELPVAQHSTARFMGLISFLDACINSDAEAAELCVFLDSNVFLSRRGASTNSFVDLAPAVFAAHPGWVALQPPSICHHHEFLDERTKRCRAEPANAASSSSHHMVVNRTRLVQVLPLPLAPADFAQDFDRVWGKALAALGGLGQMLCGAETCAIHPDLLGATLGKDTSDVANASAGSIATVSAEGMPDVADDLLRSQKANSNQKAATAVSEEGLRALLECLQTGRLVANSTGKCRAPGPALGRSRYHRAHEITDGAERAEAVVQGTLLLRLAQSTDKGLTKRH
mmetsp:Transcript_55919/g.92585  ORF Transcript_55919/g.92585 Transcript_55919/m.92585 type:complete len:480 (-) Transcript_55919:19-1458(-)